ncbi:MAG: hypoxanthine phosphoribosyltransferase [Flavobacteriales bacterium]|nr:hypoxanthine phosphoribosyltransferase [Flavobacteriales bacterium]
MPETSSDRTKVRSHDKEFAPFISAEELDAAIKRLALEVRTAYMGKRPLFVGVLNGAYYFAARLLEAMPELECEITFVKVASYIGTSSSGNVTQLIGLHERMEERHVVVLEDIVDTGNTVAHILDALKEHHPASVAIATMLFKPEAYRHDLPIAHVALRIPNAFVIGSGLDHDGLCRNLPGIWRIIDEHA